VFEHGQAVSILRIKATKYMESYPGPDFLGPNTALHARIDMLLAGRELSARKLQSLGSNLDYRLDQMFTASRYNHFLKSDSFRETGTCWELADCEEFDTFDFGVKLDKTSRAKWEKMWDAVEKADIFDSQEPGQGYGYTKGINYIIALVMKAGWNREVTMAKLAKLQHVRRKLSQQAWNNIIFDLSAR
jgi:hypothetical protein